MITKTAGYSEDRLTVEPVRGLRGEMTVPGDKSISHRAVMLGSIAEGITNITGLLWSEDNLRSVEALKMMGVAIEPDNGLLTIHGRGLNGLREPDDVLFAGNSGTATRLFAGLLAGQAFFSVITGDDSLRKRPMDRVTGPLTRMGARIFGRQHGRYAPLAIVGNRLNGIDFTSSIASAQVKSAILIASLYADNDTTYNEPFKSRDHTERMMRAFGAAISVDGTRINISGKRGLNGCEIIIPGDVSSAAFFIVAALITPESELLIKGVGVNPTRTGLINLLKRMGARVDILNKSIVSFEPVADILVRSSSLHGIEIDKEDVPMTIDELPILCVAAAAAEGRTVIRGASELRVKESDRITAMAEGLSMLGAGVKELPDGMIVDGGHRLTGARVKSYGDHRIAMSLIIAGMIAADSTEVIGVKCINTSFPGFYDSLRGVVI